MGFRSACKKPLSSRSPCLPHQRSVRAFAPLLAPHECFSGGIFRDGLLCKWHLSCDLPREREGRREGEERKREREGEARWRQGKDGRLPESLCTVDPSALLSARCPISLPEGLIWSPFSHFLPPPPPPPCSPFPAAPWAVAGRGRPCFLPE